MDELKPSNQDENSKQLLILGQKLDYVNFIGYKLQFVLVDLKAVSETLVWTKPPGKLCLSQVPSGFWNCVVWKQKQDFGIYSITLLNPSVDCELRCVRVLLCVHSSSWQKAEFKSRLHFLPSVISSWGLFTHTRINKHIRSIKVPCDLLSNVIFMSGST